MAIIELDDFDAWSDLGLVDIEDIVLFSPMLVFLIDWAESRGNLSKDLLAMELFKKKFEDMKSSEISMKEFVFDALDSKIVGSNFKDLVISTFIEDYVTLGEYQDNLMEIFQVELFKLPNNFDQSEQLYRRIDTAFSNYIENKKTFPNLSSFDDPDFLLKHKDEYLKLNEELGEQNR